MIPYLVNSEACFEDPKLVLINSSFECVFFQRVKITQTFMYQIYVTTDKLSQAMFTYKLCFAVYFKSFIVSLSMPTCQLN